MRPSTSSVKTDAHCYVGPFGKSTVLGEIQGGRREWSFSEEQWVGKSVEEAISELHSGDVSGVVDDVMGSCLTDDEREAIGNVQSS